MKTLPAIIFILFTCIPIGTSVAGPWYEKRCYEQQAEGGAAVRACFARYQALEAKKHTEKKCNPKACIYKLSFHSKNPQSSGIEAITYKGYGFTFIEWDASIPQNEKGEPGGRLIDTNGKTTIMRTCIGSWCEGKYYYGSGALKGAELSPIDTRYEQEMGWLLRLPK